MGTTTALSVGLPTLLDLMKQKNPDGSDAQIVELLTQRCPMLEDMGFQECNGLTGHVVTSRTALPSVNWVRLNEGVGPTKGKTAQVTETCGRMMSYSVVDAELVRLNGAGFRVNEDAAHLQSMTHDLQDAVIYHSTETAPEQIQGFACRYDATSTATCAAGNQIVLADSGASGTDSTSIWGITWGPKGAYGIFPKGTSGGFEGQDRGLVDWDDTSGTEASPKKFPAYVKNFQWRFGLAVEDWQQCVRIANIDTSALTADAATGSDLIDCIIKAFYKVRNPEAGRFVWYANRTVLSYLHRQAVNKANSTLTVDNVAGKPIVSILGFPIKRVDALTDAESELT